MAAHEYVVGPDDTFQRRHDPKHRRGQRFTAGMQEVTGMGSARCGIRVVVLFAAMLVVASPASSQHEQKKAPGQVRPAVVEIYITKGEMDCSVNGVACGSKDRDFLHMLGEIAEQHGRDWPVIVILHPKVPVLWIGGVQGIAEKAQLRNVRFFVVSQFGPVMGEVKWGVQIPYSRKLSTVPPDK